MRITQGTFSYLPDFTDEDISSFQGSIDYPQPESALRNQKRDAGKNARKDD